MNTSVSHPTLPRMRKAIAAHTCLGEDDFLHADVSLQIHLSRLGKSRKTKPRGLLVLSAGSSRASSPSSCPSCRSTLA